MMHDFCQRDQLWADAKLGKSNLTLGKSGCTATCIADLSTYFGDNFDPADIAAMDIFTPDGLIIWAKCNFKTFQFAQRVYRRDDSQIRGALLDPNLAVILQVSNGSHWVVATGLRSQGQILMIADPWFGDRDSMLRYENNITGFAIFRAK
jgi:hypothetical protein